MKPVLFSQGLFCCSSSLWLNRGGPAAVCQSERMCPQEVFFFFFPPGPCHLPQTHCEEQCQEEEDVRVFHRVCALTQVTGGEFIGYRLSRQSSRCLQQRRCTFHYRVDAASSHLNLAIQLPSQLIMGNLFMMGKKFGHTHQQIVYLNQTMDDVLHF